MIQASGQTALADTTAAQRKALLAVLANCPVRKTLAQPLRFTPMQP